MRRMKNQQFQKLFIKNWGLIFLYMVILLTIFVGVIWYFTKKTLMAEVDMAAERSTNGSVATVNTLFEETNSVLEKLIVDQELYTFCREKYILPIPYSFVYASTRVLEMLDKENRTDLYYSIDVYSESSQYILSTKLRGTRYDRMYDTGIVDDFFSYSEHKGGAIYFAIPRLYTLNANESKKVISIYKGRILAEGKKAFVSISMDINKLSGYIVDPNDYIRQRYLIVDAQHNVVMDTAGRLDNTNFNLTDKNNSSITMEVEGQSMRVFYKKLDYFDWYCVQLVPIVEIQKSIMLLRNLEISLVLASAVVAAVLSYRATSKLFKPIESILRLLENPTDELNVQDESGEIQYLLMSILEVFEKKIVLEKEMLERVTALRRTRAKALQEQMTPHFLGNTLQAINWIAIEETSGEDSSTCQAIRLLADTICSVKAQTMNITTVADELDYIKKFFELERLRFGPNIHLYYNVTERAEEIPIPCISLQTLVENSILHGLQPKGACGGVYIYIYDMPDGGLTIRVEDDGVGIHQEKINEIMEQMKGEFTYIGEHFGIINLFQRFRLIYGDRCRFEIRGSSHGGTCVEIITPNLPLDWLINDSKK